MSVLVTGGAGYIGSHMLHALHDAGEPAVALDDLSTGAARLVPTGVPLIVGDCGNAEVLTKAIREHRVTAIAHFAASAVVPESVAQPLRYYENNVVNTLSLIEVAVRERIPHVVFSSTAAVYGDPERLPVNEDAPARPMSPYGWSKLMCEHMLADAARSHGFKFVTLRYFNVAGADPSMRTGQSSSEATHLIKVAVQAALGHRPHMAVFGTDYPTPDGTCIRDYIHVSDLVQAHLDALRYLRSGSDSVTLNCGYGHGASVLEVIEAVKRRSGSAFKVERTGRRAGDPARIVASADRARAVLGFRPRYDDLDTIVDHALAWERQLAARAART